MLLYVNQDGSQFKRVIKPTDPCDLNDAYEHLREIGFSFFPAQDASDENSDLFSLIKAINALSIWQQIELANTIYCLTQHNDRLQFYNLQNYEKDRKRFFNQCHGTDQEFKDEFVTGRRGILKPLNRLYYDYYDYKHPEFAEISANLTEDEIRSILKTLNLFSPKTKWHSWNFNNKYGENIYAWIFNEQQLPINVNSTLIDNGKDNYLGDSWQECLNTVLLDYPIYEIADCDAHGKTVNDSYRIVRNRKLSQAANTTNDCQNPELDEYMLQIYEMKPMN